MKNLKTILILSTVILLSISSAVFSISKPENQDDKWKVLQFPYENMMDDHFRRLVDEFNINKKLPQNKYEFEEYRNKIINGLWKSFGWKPNKKTDLHARITGKTDMGDYIIEKLLFQSMPGVYVTANVFVPKNITSPVPAIICPHGHWEYGRYQPQVQSRGIGLAKLGYVALMLDAYGFGERKYTGHGNSYFLFPTGITLEGLQIWDNMRAVDYLLTRDDVDQQKIGITGASGGGNQTIYTGLLDPRIKVVVPVASLCTLKGLIFRGIGCVCKTTPNILRYADLWDITAATAPKPLLYINAVLDPIFPISAGRESFFETKKIYNIINEGEKVKKVEVFAKHDYNKSMREAMYGWFDHWFKNKAGFHTEEPEFSTLPVDTEVFKVLSNGVELESPETLLSLNYKIAKNLPLKKEIRNKKDWEIHKTTLQNKLIDEIFGGFPLEKPYEARITRKIEEDNFRFEKILYRSEYDIYIPSLILLPKTESTKKPVIIYLNRLGKEEALKEKMVVEFINNGYAVMLPDLRGTGETALSPQKPESGESIIVRNSIVSGRHIFGERVYDIIMAGDFMSIHPEIDKEKVFVYGKSAEGLMALFAGALSDKIKGVIAENIPDSYISQEEFKHPYIIFIPNILKLADIPDIASLAAVKRLLIINAVSSVNKPLSNEELYSTFSRTTKIYELLNSEKNLKLLTTHEENIFNEIKDFLEYEQ